MNHITNLYKNKCEQLQEQVQYLTRRLNEAREPTPLYREVSGSDLQLGGLTRPGSVDYIKPTNPDVNGFPRQPIDGDFFIDTYYYTWVFSEGVWKCIASDPIRWRAQHPNSEGYRPKVNIDTIYDPNDPGSVRSPGPPSPYSTVPAFRTWNRSGGILGVRG
jgi:hypothetical protein